MKITKTYFIYITLILSLFMFSCASKQELDIDYSFKASTNVKKNIENFNQVDFKAYDNLDLGFYKGNVWIKLEVKNTNKQASYIVLTNDLINRNYKFYKLDAIDNKMKPASIVQDFTKHDYRTFNNPKPNFKIDLEPNEEATFIISTESDGRILQATPQLLNLDEYHKLIDNKTLVNIVFFMIIGILLLINIFHWSLLKNKIYYYYGLYIVSSCLFYLNVEGYLYGLGFNHTTVDHFMFVSIRFWIFSLLLFTSKFLELKITHPKYFNYIKWTLFIILGITTFYQFLFFNTSISKLHMIENLLGFLWVIIVIFILVLSFKKRKLESTYYLIAFSFLIFFVTLGLIDSHTAMLPGDPFSYFKIGTIVEFIGFTYFITLIIKRNFKQAHVLEKELVKNQQELLVVSKQLKSKSVEKTDLLTIFKLLESSLSKQSEWLEFKSKFEQLDPYFLTNLKKQHPDLSKSEIRLLILIRIGFTQKEIANILNIAHDSAKKARQRVRKKLNISKSTSLREYLLSVN